MKRILSVILCAAMIAVSLCGVSADGFTLPESVEIAFRVGDSTLLINGNAVKVETPYIAGYGTTLVPLRVITEAFGAIVTWDGNTKSITLDYPNTEIILQIDNKTAKVNRNYYEGNLVKIDRQRTELEVAPVLTVNGVTMVPLRFISESFGAEVGYDDETRAILVKKNTVLHDTEEKLGELSAFYDAGNGLHNTYVKLNRDKSLRIGYFGGSVTGGTNWATDWFRENFPDAEITEINAAIGATGGRFGAFRIYGDLISQAPDIVFLEYAINDKYYGETYDTAALYFEYMVRSIKKELPNCDIVTVLIHDRTTIYGKTYSQYNAHKDVSAYYGIPTVRVADYFLTQLPDSSDAMWQRYFSDVVHPKKSGYEIYKKPIAEMLHDTLLCSNDTLELESSELPAAKYGGDAVLHTLCANLDDFKIIRGWKYDPKGKVEFVKNSPYEGTFTAEDEDNLIEFTFTGTDCFLMSMYPAGTFYYRIDGGVENKSTMQNTPVKVCEGASRGKHKVSIRAEKDFRFGGILYK